MIHANKEKNNEVIVKISTYTYMYHANKENEQFLKACC